MGFFSVFFSACDACKQVLIVRRFLREVFMKILSIYKPSLMPAISFFVLSELPFHVVNYLHFLIHQNLRQISFSHAVNSSIGYFLLSFKAWTHEHMNIVRSPGGNLWRQWESFVSTLSDDLFHVWAEINYV